MTQQNGKTVRIFSARACAAPLEKAADLYTRKTGVEILIDMCDRHCASPVAEEATAESAHDDFLLEISDAGIHDLAIAGAEYLLDDGEVRGIVKKGYRRTIGYRTSALIVPAGNPAGIQSIEDLARPGVRVAISLLDCLKGVWEDITARLGLLDKIRPNITYKANGCVAIVEAIATKEADVAFGWTAFRHLEPDRIEVIELPKEQQILRGTGVGMLSFVKEEKPAVAFMDFLASAQARKFYQELGWEVPTE